MLRTKRIIHKAKWQVLEGFFIAHVNAYAKSLCGKDVYVHRATSNKFKNVSQRWGGVTCKNCLKMRKSR